LGKLQFVNCEQFVNELAKKKKNEKEIVLEINRTKTMSMSADG